MSHFVNAQLIVNMIKTKLKCDNLYAIVEDKTNIVLDLNEQLVYFEIEIIKSGYVLTKTVFTNKLQKQSEFTIYFDYISQVNDHIVNYTLTTNKTKGIPCTRI